MLLPRRIADQVGRLAGTPLPPSLLAVDIMLLGEQPLDMVVAGPKYMYKALILQKGTRTTALQ